MTIKEIAAKMESETPYIAARLGSVSADGAVNYFLASLPDDFQKTQSLRDAKFTARRFFVCQDAKDADVVYMCETHPDRGDFRDAEKFELDPASDMSDQIPMTKTNQSVYKFKKSTPTKLKNETTLMRFGEFLNEGVFSSAAVSFIAKIPRNDVYISSKDGIDWTADSDFTVYWSIEPSYSKSGIDWITISVQKIDGTATGVDEEDNEVGTMDNFFDGFEIVTEFDFGKDGSLHCGAIDIMLEEKTVQIS